MDSTSAGRSCARPTTLIVSLHRAAYSRAARPSSSANHCMCQHAMYVVIVIGRYLPCSALAAVCLWQLRPSFAAHYRAALPACLHHAACRRQARARPSRDLASVSLQRWPGRQVPGRRAGSCSAFFGVRGWRAFHVAADLLPAVPYASARRGRALRRSRQLLPYSTFPCWPSSRRGFPRRRRSALASAAAILLPSMVLQQLARPPAVGRHQHGHLSAALLRVAACCRAAAHLRSPAPLRAGLYTNNLAVRRRYAGRQALAAPATCW